MELWLVFAVLSYVSYAVSSSIDKYMMNHSMRPLPTNTVKMFFDGLVLLLLGVVFFDATFSMTVFTYAAGLGVLYAAAGVFYFKAMQRMDVEAFIPAQQASTVLFVFLGGIFFLSETVVLWNYIGVAAVLVGVYLVLSRDGMSVPRPGPGIGFLGMNIALGVVYTLLVKVWVAGVEPITLATAMYFTTTLFLVAYHGVFRSSSTWDVLKPDQSTLRIMVASVFGALGTFFLYTALSLGNASKVYPVAGLQAVGIFLIATLFLGEEFTWHRFLGTLAVVAGIALVSI